MRGKRNLVCSVGGSYFLPMPARSPVGEWQVCTAGAVEVGLAGFGIASENVLNLKIGPPAQREVDGLMQEM